VWAAPLAGDQAGRLGASRIISLRGTGHAAKLPRGIIERLSSQESRKFNFILGKDSDPLGGGVSRALSPSRVEIRRSIADAVSPISRRCVD
jgi:hypothetical protein